MDARTAFSRRGTIALARLALWLIAALSLAELAPAFSEISRFTKLGLMQAQCGSAENSSSEGCYRSTVEIVVTAPALAAEPTLAGAESGDPVFAHAARLSADYESASDYGSGRPPIANARPPRSFHSRAPPAAA